MERKEAIRGAYRMTGGNSFYDGMITCSTLSGKAVCRLVWAMNKAENDTFDIVLSLNGFHAFPDKEAAYREVFRVLRPGGTFCGCFYVMGEHKRTDWFVRHVYEKAGFFTPPYETVSSLKARLDGMYTDVDMGNLKSMAWFVCRKAD